MAEHKEQSRSAKGHTRVTPPVPLSPVPATEPWGSHDHIVILGPELEKSSRLLQMRPPQTLLDLHKQLRKGLPVRALMHLLALLSTMPKDHALEEALGISLRTFQRRRAAPRKPLSTEQSARIFKFAEILTKATQVFGSQEAAQAWLARPAMGLDRQRPIDLLATPAGAELVETFLGRLEYGVYT